jgi:pimeloyl-ACP methyl ester carboxylesterase
MPDFAAHLVPHDGLSFPVIERGDGPPLILLHGGGSRATHFLPLMAALAPHFRAIAYDQRGFAANRVAPDHAIDHALWASDLVGMLDGMGIERAPVLGWSLGCSVAIEAAAHRPERIAALVLVGAPDPARPVDVATLRRCQGEYATLEVPELAHRAEADIAAQLGPDCQDNGAILDALVADRMASSPAMQARVIEAYATRPDLLALAGRVHAPAMLVTGEHDRVSPPAAAAAMARALGAPEPEIVAGAGHPLAAERPELLARLVAERLPALLSSR